MKLRGFAEVDTQSDEEIEIIMLEYETVNVTGKVINQQGEPIQSANMKIVKWEGDYGIGTSAGIADASGRYAINDLIVGEEYYVGASADGYRDGSTKKFTASKDMKTLPDIILRTKGAFFIEGTVKDTTGKPVIGARVTSQSTQEIAITDNNGHYRIDGLSKIVEVGISVNCDGYGITHFKYITTNEKHDLVIEKSDGYLAGKVVDTNGKPVGGALIYVVSELPTDSGYSGHVNVATNTDANGNFRLPDLIVNKKENIYVGVEGIGYKVFRDVEMNRDDVVFTFKAEFSPTEPQQPTAEQKEKQRYREELDRRSAELQGKSAPQLDVDQWISGTPVDLAKQRGKIIVLDFRQYFWRGENGQELEHKDSLAVIRFLNALQKAFADKGVVFVSIHGYTQKVDEVKRLVREQKPIYNIAIDKKSPLKFAKGVTFDRFGESWGKFVLIDRNGNIKYQTIWDNELEDKLRDMIMEK